MEPNKTIKEEDKLEKELKTLVSRMKNENSALKKILFKLKEENEQNDVKNNNTKISNQ
jgi:hypothetical protein